MIWEKNAAIPLCLTSMVSPGFINIPAIFSKALTDLAFGYCKDTGDCCITLLANI